MSANDWIAIASIAVSLVIGGYATLARWAISQTIAGVELRIVRLEAQIGGAETKIQELRTGLAIANDRDIAHSRTAVQMDDLRSSVDAMRGQLVEVLATLRGTRRVSTVEE